MKNKEIRKIVKEKIKGQHLNIILIIILSKIVTFFLRYIQFPYVTSLDPELKYSLPNFSIGFIDNFYTNIVQIIVLSICLRYIRGSIENITLSNISSTFNNLPKKICVAFIYTLIINFFTIIELLPNKSVAITILLVLSIPAIYLSLAYTFVFFIADDHPDMSIINIFKQSRKINNRKTTKTE